MTERVLDEIRELTDQEMDQVSAGSLFGWALQTLGAVTGNPVAVVVGTIAQTPEAH